MVISLSKEKKEGIKITTKIFWNLLAFLGLALLIFLFLKLYNSNLQARIKETNTEIQNIEAQRDPKIEKKIKDTLNNYEMVSKVLASHTNARKVLNFIQRNTYEGVTFSTFGYNLKENSVSLNVSSKSASNLSMQLAAFKIAKGTQDVEVGGFSMNDKVINLQLKIIFDPSIVKF